MNLEYLQNLPMTQTERGLKQCIAQFPDLKRRIVSSTELFQYIEWMIHIYGKPEDEELFYNRPGGYENHKEDLYLLSNHDISVGRMLRYMPAHWHTNEFFEIYYAYSGTCPVHFKDEIVYVKPGTVLIVAPGVAHASPCYADDCVLFYYMIRSSTFDKVFWNQLPPENLMSTFFRQALYEQKNTAYLHFETQTDSDIKMLLYRVYKEFLENETYSAQMLNALLCECFILLLRRYEGTARLPRTEDFHWKHEFSAIFSYIQTHYQLITLPKVAQKFHYSERQVTRIIQNCMGMNFAQLILKLKMERAGTLLKQGTASIEQISTIIGYSTVSSFYRAFEKYYHCTPAEYRTDSGCSM